MDSNVCAGAAHGHGRQNGWWLALLMLLMSTFSARADLYWGVNGAGGSGSWDNTNANWWNGTSNVVWDQGNAIFAGTGGTVTSFTFGPTVAGLTFNSPGYLIDQGWLGTGSTLTITTNEDAALNSVLNSSAIDSTLVKNGPATLTLRTTNFLDRIQLNEGELVAGSNSATTFSALTMANAAGVKLTIASSSGGLAGLSGGGSLGGVVQPAAGRGATSLSIDGTGSFAGTIADNQGAVLSVVFYGTQTLVNPNSYSGATTVSGSLMLSDNGALTSTSAVAITSQVGLSLDNTAQAVANRIPDSAAVSLSGQIQLKGNASIPLEETMGALTFTRNAVVVVNQPDSAATSLVLASVTRSGHGTLALSGTGQIRVQSGALTNGILPVSFSTGSEWVTLSLNNSIQPFSAYATDPQTTGPSDHLKLSGGGTSLLQADAGAATLNLQNGSRFDLGGRNFLLASGGVLSSGAAPTEVANGTLSANGELLITIANTLTISAQLRDQGTPLALTKSGPGTLQLTNANSFTGDIFLEAGTLAVTSNESLGHGSKVQWDGGKIQALADFTWSKTISGSGTFDTNGHNVVMAGSISGILSKDGAGTLTLNRSALGTISAGGGTLATGHVSSGSVSLSNATLEADGRLNSLNCGIGAIISPGGTAAGTLILDQSSIISRATLRMDVGMGTGDFLYFGTAPGFPSGMQVSFSDLGGATAGVDYPLLGVPGSSVGSSSLNPSSFSFSPTSTQQGWRGSFSVANNTLSVRFTAVPEPAAVSLIMMGALAISARRRRRA